MAGLITGRYPEVEKLCLEGAHREESTGEQTRCVRYAGDLPVYIPCANSECEGRGYFMGTILKKLICDRATTYTGDWTCDGCSYWFRFTLRLIYRFETDSLIQRSMERMKSSDPVVNRLSGMAPYAGAIRRAAERKGRA